MSSSSQDAQDHSGQEQEVDPSFTCTVCMEVLLDPVTPPCGHSLDQRCMQKLVEARGKRACPTCRAVLPKDLPCVSVQFRDVVEQRYPKQVAERRAEARKEAANTNDSQVLPTTPLAGDHPAATAPAASTSAAAASPHSDGDGTAAAEVTVETRPVDSNAACFGTLPRGMLLPATVSYVLLQMVFFAVAISTTGTTSTHVNPMIGTDTAGLRALGATWTQGVREYNEWWRVLTAGVVHAGLIDLVFSGCGVVLAGSRLERRHGALFMLELILVSVAAGGLTAHLLSSERVTTGGVSVFFGLIGAMGVDALVNRNHVIFGSNADMTALASLLAVNVLLCVMPLVSPFACLAGLTFGALIALMLMSPIAQPGQRARRPLPELQLGAGVAVVVLLLSGFTLLTWQDANTLCAQCHAYTCIHTTLWDCDPPLE